MQQFGLSRSYGRSMYEQGRSWMLHCTVVLARQGLCILPVMDGALYGNCRTMLLSAYSPVPSEAYHYVCVTP